MSKSGSRVGGRRASPANRSSNTTSVRTASIRGQLDAPKPKSLAGWNIPAPKGVIPQTATDADEVGRFSSTSAGVDRNRLRNKRVSEAALQGASTRMRGQRIIEEQEEQEEQNRDEDQPEEDLDALGEGEDLVDPNLDYDDDDDASEISRLEQQLEARKQRAGISARGLQQQPQQRQQQSEPATTYPYVTTFPPTIEDTDRLWDWVRSDDDNGQAFFSIALANSRQLHDVIQGLVNAEARGTGLVRSIYVVQSKTARVHVGTAALVPILSTERTAMMHIYLSQNVRGELARIAPPLIEEAASLVPGYHLAVYSPDEKWRRIHRAILTPLGFAEQVMFVR